MTLRRPHTSSRASREGHRRRRSSQAVRTTHATYLFIPAQILTPLVSLTMALRSPAPFLALGCLLGDWDSDSIVPPSVSTSNMILANMFSLCPLVPASSLNSYATCLIDDDIEISGSLPCPSLSTWNMGFRLYCVVPSVSTSNMIPSDLKFLDLALPLNSVLEAICIN
jgi:hypothetical protein